MEFETNYVFLKYIVQLQKYVDDLMNEAIYPEHSVLLPHILEIQKIQFELAMFSNTTVMMSKEEYEKVKHLFEDNNDGK